MQIEYLNRTISKLRWSFLLLFLCMSFFAEASFNVYTFSDSNKEIRFKRLIAELRCPKCQNNNLADSDAPLATDIKNYIYESVQAGKTDEEITEYLISRYGDFVTYKPPFEGAGMVAWLLPVAFLLIILIFVGLAFVEKSKKKKVITLEPDAARKMIAEAATKLNRS